MADTTRNVFSLSDWRSQQVDGEGVDVSNVSIRKGGGGPRTAPFVGYFMGGNNSSSGSYVDKVNLSNSTVSSSTPAIQSTRGIAGKVLVMLVTYFILVENLMMCQLGTMQQTLHFKWVVNLI